jgi:hypothetical protein
MSLTAVLSESTLSAAPGESVSLQVTVRNTGGVVDEFYLEVLGSAAEWAVIDPPSLSLFPDDDGTAVVTFNVPRDMGVRSGDVPFAVQLRSREDQEGTIVEEGLLMLGGFIDLAAELMPESSRGFLVGRHEITLDNLGNTPVVAALRGVDPNGKLRFQFDSPGLRSEPGSATFATVAVRPRQPLLKGGAQTLPFQVVLEIEEQEPIVLDGSMVQRPIFKNGIGAILGILLGVILLLVALWLVFLKPRVQSTARSAVARPLSQTNAAVNDIGAKVGSNPELPTTEEAVAAAAEAPAADGGAAKKAVTPGAPAGSGAASIVTEFGNPTDRRLLATGTGTVTDGFKIDDGKVFSLTDLVFQNPAGDTGSITLLRGKDTLFLDSLANFRNLDYHFVAPIVFGEKVDVTLRVECANPQGRPCSVAAYLVGFIKAT